MVYAKRFLDETRSLSLYGVFNSHTLTGFVWPRCDVLENEAEEGACPVSENWLFLSGLSSTEYEKSDPNGFLFLDEGCLM